MIHLVTVHSKGYRMVNPKTGERKFWPEMFLMGLEVSFSDDFCISESQIFLPRGFKVLDFFSAWSSGV